ncbi:MAG: hypothetical protein AAF798_21785 [Bacteroidota bacterium]
MKKVFLSLVLVSFFACNNVAQYAEAIGTLSSDWESTTQLVTALTGKISGAQEMLSGLQGQMNLTDEVKGLLSEDQLGLVTQYITQFGGFNDVIGNLSSEVFGFVGNWQEKAKDLEALTSGLEAGKIEGDIQAKIAGLSTMVTEAKGKVAGWEETLSGTTSKAQSVFGQFKSIIDAVMPASE